MTGFSLEEINAIIGTEDISYMDALSEENFSTIDSASENERFQITIYFNRDDEETIKDFVRNNGVDKISEIVIDHLKNSSENKND